MPELPDVEIFRKEAVKCKNSGIERIEVFDAKFVKNSENELNKIFKGKHFKKVLRRGKYLFLTAEKGEAIVMHFGMTGNLDYLKKNEEVPKYTRCSFFFKNKHALHVISRRKLGYIESAADSERYINEKELGKDAMELSKSEFLNLFRNKNSMIKTALTDQSMMSGIGNVYADEILYQARVHPRKRTNQISDKEMLRLFDEMKRVLETAIEKGADVNKLPGDFLLPVRKEGNSCPGCKGKLEMTKISGRTTYFCPSCQKN